ncbi:protein of unknown function [Parapedobacter composti]|uniref:GH141-like insertion domain-containing protein n=1 Tax=Parapedobacter composti TaxID=623281 RepID=A0A1I1GYG4_9SPHI|nr:L-rhamnose mutarotase [Parapedobacter composti]SFC14908.1 protein of unknown function [Parapedobacter composti]
MMIFGKNPLIDFLLTMVALVLWASPARATEIWVSPQGKSSGDGTAGSPYATVSEALRKARELRRMGDPSVAQGITIIVRDGEYWLEEPIFVRPEDSGTAQSPTVVRADRGAQPVLSGGRLISGWRKAGKMDGIAAAAAGHLWVAEAPRIAGNVVDFRQLWINGRKAQRSRSHRGTEMGRILSWNHEEQTCWVPLPENTGFRFEEGMELFIQQWWAIAMLRIAEVEVQGDSARLSFYQPESRIQSEHPWPAPWISEETGNSAYWLTNARQFLDEPGEWYLDKRAGKLYYWPREGENMTTAEVIYPVLETLLILQGSADRPVRDVRFEGITFRYSTWLRPSAFGHVPLQAGMYLLDAYKLKPPGTPGRPSLENQAWVGRPPAAVQFSFTANTAVEHCRFEHLAATALDFVKGNNGDRAVGNVFSDVGGSGVLLGTFSEEATEAHLPYLPFDLRELTRQVYVANNVITDVANEDWGCVGIGAGFVRGVVIEHNDISEVSYTGISLGWGWTPAVNAMQHNRVVANRICRYGKHLYDVAGIYTLSAQPGTLIAENSIDSIYKAPYAHLPDHWFYLYTDEGTAYATLRDNWYPSDKTLQNANGPGNTWEYNGPAVDPAVRDSAGLTADFRQLARYRKLYDDRYEINTHVPFTKPVVVQVEAAGHPDIQAATLEAIAKKQGDPQPEIRRWNDRYVLITRDAVAKKFHGAMLALYPRVRTTVFNDLFYAFDRADCSDATQQTSVDFVLLTANLVDDERQQQAYFDYHERQRSDWPEVVQGFCRAEFQEVLLYRSGRQLMLMITFPVGKDFQQLNRKTVEGNPRVDEWNRLMSVYQQGIPGASPGETWVYFK